MNHDANPIGILGIAGVEFAAPTSEGVQSIERLLFALGFSRAGRHAERDVELFEQGEMQLLVSHERAGFAAEFAAAHGPSIAALHLWVTDSQRAQREAVERGARPFRGALLTAGATAIYGIGDSLIVFDERPTAGLLRGFLPLDRPERVPGLGFTRIDHLTNNVEQGTLGVWQRFYKDVLGFTDVRTFDIRGQKTGLVSYALRSPCGTFCIPINEGSEDKSQIEEYLREYRGPGIQHLALLSEDLLSSLGSLAASGVETLDIEPSYYQTVFERVPNVREDRARIEQLRVLVDGDADGYLLQIFTKNVIGPIFFELIQRNNHLSFGEGNFGALFRSIERDQERRGVL